CEDSQRGRKPSCGGREDTDRLRVARFVEMCRPIISEEDDDIGRRLIGLFHDGLKAIKAHIRFTEMNIRDSRHRECQTGWPLLRRWTVSFDVESVRRLKPDPPGQPVGSNGSPPN